ncbi:manganese efflux pump MntP family protein [Peptococcus simiae]|uniref:manganese efflux pump MntP n=1 Tax=Peptococcus simiae TaxID=1643805 RepID=UPI0039813A7E
MGIVEVILIGVGLSMDACAVALCNILGLAGGDQRRLWLMPVFFGAFQALMPSLGYGPGIGLAHIIGSYGPYVVAAVLALIGLNMLRETHKGEATCNLQALSLWVLTTQAVATAIDAFFVGVSFGAAGTPLVYVLVIGATTAVLVTLTILLARPLGRFLGNKAEWVGGFLLLVVAAIQLI